ncbi:MAG: signal peptide peptidase SppA [Phycisphaeraceae bacterium]
MSGSVNWSRRLCPAWLVLASMMALLLGAGGCRPMTFAVGVAPGDQRLTRTTVASDGGFGNARIAIVDVTGLIINAEKPGLLQPGENPVGLLHEKLALAAADRRVEAVILRINSPGGTVTASDAMYREVQRFRQSTGKPVIALMMDVAASGGYYVACASDHIMTYPTAVTGSIGVIVQTISVKPALERWGVQAEAFTSGENKAAGSPLGTLTDGQRAMLQTMVDDFYARFAAVVREARPMLDDATFERVADGRVMTGGNAVAVGLADEVGDLYDAFALGKAMVGVDRADLVLYHRPLDYAGSPYAASASGGQAGRATGTQVNLMQINLDGLPGFAGAPVGIYYLWRPDVQ